MNDLMYSALDCLPLHLYFVLIIISSPILSDAGLA